MITASTILHNPYTTKKANSTEKTSKIVLYTTGAVGLEPTISGFGAEQSFGKELNKIRQLSTH